MDHFEQSQASFIRYFQIGGGAVGGLFLATCLHAQTSSPSKAPSGPITAQALEVFGEKFAAIQPAPLSQTRIIIYRTKSAGTLEPVNVYLARRYHTSLLKGGYTEFCSGPGRVEIHAVLNDAQYQHLGNTTPVQPWTFQAGKTLFLKVTEASNAWGALVEVTNEQAIRELTETAEQIHTVSRAPLVQPCQSPAAVVATPAPVAAKTPVMAPAPAPMVAVAPKVIPPRLYALETDALFEFGKAEFKASSYNAIENMVQNLLRDYSKVERIRVVGHTDAIGPVKLNQKLSLQRAQVVADQLKARGVVPTSGFKVEGAGDERLVKVSCGKKPTPENKICHAPNRRVEIVVTGAKR